MCPADQEEAPKPEGEEKPEPKRVKTRIQKRVRIMVCEICYLPGGTLRYAKDKHGKRGRVHYIPGMEEGQACLAIAKGHLFNRAKVLKTQEFKTQGEINKWMREELRTFTEKLVKAGLAREKVEAWITKL